LVHGFADLGAGWCELAPLLAPHGRVLAPDLRGHGDSDWIGPGGYYHFMDYVVDLDDLIRDLVAADQRLIVVGHSMGGTISGYFAGTRPDRPAALVLIEGLGPPDMMGGEGPTRTAAWIDAWRAAAATRTRPKEMTLAEAVTRIRRHDHLVDERLAEKLARFGTRPAPGRPEAVVWKHDPLHATFGPYAYRLESARRYWERITCPVLAIDGAQSKLNLGAAERAARRATFKNIRHLVIENAGHAVQRHQPRELAAAILDHGIVR
jgi:pimeloyl-ACP methyl ester carboxylesterase